MAENNNNEKDKYFTIRLRASKYEFKKFKEAKDIGFTQREVVEKLIQCNGVEFTIFDKQTSSSVTFPKNFLLKDRRKKNAESDRSSQKD